MNWSILFIDESFIDICPVIGILIYIQFLTRFSLPSSVCSFEDICATVYEILYLKLKLTRKETW